MTTDLRIGVDVGGTFTDFVAFDAATGQATTWKEPSRPHDPSAPVGEGVGALLKAAGRAPGEAGLVVHGTTLALNAILERRTGPTGLVVTRGFGDMLVIGRGGLPNAYSFKDPKRAPPIPRRHVYEVNARLSTDGGVLARPAAGEVETLADRIREDGLTALAVLVINSYAHPTLEAEIADRLAALLPGVLVTPSAGLWPEVREFERALTTVLNGAVHGLMDRYYGALSERLGTAGVAAPLFVTTSNGGTVSVSTARARPIETLLSGPAGGVVAAARLAEALELGDIVTLDVGGTSSDLAIVRGNQPEITNETRVGDFSIMLPVVHVWAIGAGGGSIVWVDDQGLMKVGPHSAGADPGPVCYGQGASEPTVTDCILVLGFLDPERFLSGRMRLDVEAARAALAAIGNRIGLEGPDAAEQAAAAALRIASAKMATEISKGMAERGLDPADFTLLPYGGGGPTMAGLLAAEARMDRITIPPAPATFCALGAVLAPIRREFARSNRLVLGRDEGAGQRLRETAEALDREAREWIAGEGAGTGEVSVTILADMQYPRTATETTVEIQEEVWRSGDDAALAGCFHAEHERLYTFRDAESPVAVTTVRARVTATPPALVLPEVGQGAGRPEPDGHRRVIFTSGPAEAALYRVSDLQAGDAFAGPAIVDLGDSTAVVPPDYEARVDRYGVLHMAREEKA